jgi:hypothetical protein
VPLRAIDFHVHLPTPDWLDGSMAHRIPAEVTGELTGRLSGQFLWGSDYPFIPPERCLSELDGLGLTAEVQDAVLRANAARILGLDG